MTLLALGDATVGAAVLALGAFLAADGIVNVEDWECRLRVVLLVAGVFGPVGILPLTVGIGLWRLRSWARNQQLLLGFAALLYCVPLLLFSDLVLVGTWLLGALAASAMAALTYLSRPAVKGLFSGRPGRPLVATAALVLLAHALGLFMLGLSSGMRCGSASVHESATIGDIRTVISAQAAYAEANGGFYDRLECLGEPVRCLPGYNGPHFLDSVLASGAEKSGYARTFHSGPLASQDAVASAKVSASSLKSYAYVAVPLRPGKTGVRGFCGDSTGGLCFTADGTAPQVQDGLCVHGVREDGSSPRPSECETLQ